MEKEILLAAEKLMDDKEELGCKDIRKELKKNFKKEDEEFEEKDQETVQNEPDAFIYATFIILYKMIFFHFQHKYYDTG